MKKIYEKPELKVTSFEAKEAIALSSATTQTGFNTANFNVVDY